MSPHGLHFPTAHPKGPFFRIRFTPSWNDYPATLYNAHDGRLSLQVINTDRSKLTRIFTESIPMPCFICTTFGTQEAALGQRPVACCDGEEERQHVKKPLAEACWLSADPSWQSYPDRVSVA